MKKILQILLFIAFVLVLSSIVSAQIAIESFSSSPETLEPGEQGDIEITLQNVGKEDIQNILVSLDLTELPFAPVDSSSEGIIEEIENDESETISFTLEALANAEPGIYKIPVLISYENTSKTALISIEVKADASLELLY